MAGLTDAEEREDARKITALPPPGRRSLNAHMLVLCTADHAFASEWAQLESGTFRFREPLNKERRFLPLRLDDARSAETFHEAGGEEAVVHSAIDECPEPPSFAVGFVRDSRQSKKIW
jgi:hypothetical protein